MEDTERGQVLHLEAPMAENKQSERSRQWISDALVDLMQKKPYAHITVKDITDRAGVARLTFYRHFETKEDIPRYRFQILFSGYHHLGYSY